MKRVIMLFVPLLLVTNALGVTINVPGDQPTIQAGINSAAKGDTVLVAPGTYVENINFEGRTIVVTSSGGALVTTLIPANSYSTIKIVRGEDLGTEFSGFTVTGGGAIPTVRLHATSPVVEDCIFHHNIPVGSQNVEVIRCRGTSFIRRNLFYANGGIGCVGLWPGASGTWITNNTFDRNERGMYSIAGGGFVFNNIVTNSLDRGIGGGFGFADYNNVWNNSPDYLNGDIAGANDISVDPQYVDAPHADYRLNFVSPCIDAGHAGTQYNDPDGSRNDIGAFPLGPIGFPIAASVTFRPGPGNTPLISWVYHDTAATIQAEFEVEIGTDDDWTEAELWASGPVSSSNPSVGYTGPPLEHLTTYFYRLRVSNDISFGDWRPGSFVNKFRNVILVPTERPTIQAGIDIAADGDTVLVGPGTYFENIHYLGKSIVVTSSDGALSTTLQPADTMDHTIQIYRGGPTTEFSGFTVTAGPDIYVFVISGSSAVVKDCIFHTNIPRYCCAREVISCTTSTALITRNLFYGNRGVACVGLRAGSAGTRIINNTFDDNLRAFFSVAGGGIAINNIVTNSFEYGVGSITPGDFTVLDYNNVWNNHPDYLDTNEAGPNNISVDPGYVDAANRDYRLSLSSACVNAGHPDPQYNDPDRSRNDMGAFAVTGNSPSIPDLQFPIDLSGKPIFDLTPQFSWIPSTDPSPNDTIRYRLTVATDKNLFFAVVIDSLLANSYKWQDSLAFSEQYWWSVEAFDTEGFLSNPSDTASFWTWTLGDLNHSHLADITDLAVLVMYMFGGGAPVEPLFVADINGDCLVDISDLTYMVAYLYSSGWELQVGCE